MVAESNWIFIIPCYPLTAFLLNVFFGKRILKEKAAWVSILASVMSFLSALPFLVNSAKGTVYAGSFSWLPAGSGFLDFGYLLDPAAATLLFVVTFIGTLIQIYSSGYMHGDPRYSRFFAYISLFMAAMLTLVIADNLLLFFIAWEVMGLCSYLLIGFWFEKTSAANASKKAFLTTRIGDVGLFLGMLTVFMIFGTLNFSDLAAASHAAASHPLLPLAAFLIFCGTMGKSAQFPLHVWLPDAMEGPTPVSALIHAATMVAAGVYLLARTFPVISLSADVMHIITSIGTMTAFMAAFIALTANDIKKVLAYSTISQLGYMVAAMGLQGMQAGLFHLTTHAFFKALLFLGAGSVIHGTGTQDLREMGGLWKKMPSTAWTFLIGSLAIAGVPPLAGFWSKDEILAAAAHHTGYEVIYYTLLMTAFMTAFYMFRLFFLAFSGKPRDPKIHAHESPRSMTFPLWILALGSIAAGIPGSPLMHFWFQGFLSGPHHHAAHQLDWTLMAVSVAAGFLGIGLAFFFYLKFTSVPKVLSSKLKPLYLASYNKLWFDELYGVLLVKPFHVLGKILFLFDRTVVDGLVNNTGLVTLLTGRIHHLFDKYIVDGFVNLTGRVTALFSSQLRRIQTGVVQNYLLVVFAAVLVFIYCGIR